MSQKTQTNQVKLLLDEIHVLRNELIEIGTKKGLTHCHTLRISRELDNILNQYQTIMKK